eukprot:1145125-Pelagomonas_calceolata.AAC.3
MLLTIPEIGANVHCSSMHVMLSQGCRRSSKGKEHRIPSTAFVPCAQRLYRNNPTFLYGLACPHGLTAPHLLNAFTLLGVVIDMDRHISFGKQLCIPGCHTAVPLQATTIPSYHLRTALAGQNGRHKHKLCSGACLVVYQAKDMPTSSNESNISLAWLRLARGSWAI